jgi:mannose-6-phosphate isomerase
MSALELLNTPLRLIPEYRDYIWGGNRLKPGSSPVAEAWVLDRNDRIASGPFAGRTLADVTKEFGKDLLGTVVVERTGLDFPLLIKLLDCAAWLSLQVHPNDDQARMLEGEGFFGKTEAWHILDAAPGAKLIAGLKPGTTPDALSRSIREGTILDAAQYLQVKTGDTIFIRPGTIHALGPGLLIYEVQQTSNLTYRVFDWNRPQTGGRVLHLEKSLEVADPAAEVRVRHYRQPDDGKWNVLCQCQYFTLEMVSSGTVEIESDTRGRSFHALMVIDGSCDIVTPGGVVTLNKFDTVVVPAACGGYVLRPDKSFSTSFRMLKAFVE